MSRLGIGFVLPYQGTNGIKVTNNQIGLDPDGAGQLGSLEINPNLSLTGVVLLKLNTDNSSGGGQAIFELFNNDFEGWVLIIDNEGNINNSNNNSGGQINCSTLTSQIQIIAFAGSANNPAISILPSIGLDAIEFDQTTAVKFQNEITGAVVPSTTNYIPIVINGVTKKLIIAN